MSLHFKLYPNLYKDSVSLMQLSARTSGLEGVEQASVAMATEANIERMRDAGMAVDVAARPNDLLIALVARDSESGERALAAAGDWLKPAADTGDTGGTTRQAPPSSLAAGKEVMPDANLALISVPGAYAAAEALKALRLGLDVMIFSDNVPLAEEIAVKNVATASDRIVMGPDCGTAIVNGLPLGFANVVRRGRIGLIAASGTGLQEVCCRIHHRGEGVSQALGTGGHDLHEAVGGQSMLQGLKMLAADPGTELIVLISKPPSAAVTEKVLAAASRCGKPVVVHFLGADASVLAPYGVIPAFSLCHAGDVAVATLRGEAPPADAAADADLLAKASAALVGRKPDQSDIRGVFAGGTFCYEAQLALLAAGLNCASNVPVKGAVALGDAVGGHRLVDMGDDEFTQGRPHPMIDPTVRDARILAEASDPATAIIVFDVVLGYGASFAPIDGLLGVLEQARQTAQRDGRALLFIGHVCGTELDPQSRDALIDALRQAGVLVADSNVQAARVAANCAANCAAQLAKTL